MKRQKQERIREEQERKRYTAAREKMNRQRREEKREVQIRKRLVAVEWTLDMWMELLILMKRTREGNSHGTHGRKAE